MEGMDIQLLMQAVSAVGFPIVACGVLFYQNSKLSETIGQLEKTLVENTTILKELSNDIQRNRKEN